MKVATATALWPTRMRRLAGAAAAVYLLAPLLVVLLIFFIYPVADFLAKSFTDPEVGFQNFRALWESVAFRNIVRTTLEMALWTTGLCLVLGYLFAYQLSTLPRRWAHLFLSLSLVPFWTSILVRLYAWTVVLGRRGIINNWLVDLGLTDEPLELLFNRRAAVIGMVHFLLPLMILVLYSTMAGIDRTLIDAARSLGAGGFETFRRVTLPLSMPGVYAGALLVFIIAVGGGGRPDGHFTPQFLGGGGDISVSAYVGQNPFGVSAAIAFLLLLLLGLLVWLLSRFLGLERLFRGALGGGS